MASLFVGNIFEISTGNKRLQVDFESAIVVCLFTTDADGRRSKFLVRETRTRNLVQEIGPCVISSRTSFFSYEKLG